MENIFCTCKNDDGGKWVDTMIQMDFSAFYVPGILVSYNIDFPIEYTRIIW